MKIKTDITTLSKLYPIFEKAGIEGVLTGDLDKISELKYSDLCGKLLMTGKLAEACELITGSETCDAQEEDNKPTPWGEASREEALGVIIPFLIDITVGPLKLREAENLGI
ncbi:MAG: hypothetical protein M0P99_02465, partial [Candidatus Cloacimonetes bacterium]|nr:hypothetical protein [Candidatus Cloacimonadota bacterium]